MKILAKIIIIAAVFSLGFYLGHESALSPTNGEINQNIREISVDLRVDYAGLRDNQSFSSKISSSATVFDLMNSLSEDGLEFTYQDYGDMGAMITSIGGLGNDPVNDLWWQLYINGEYAKVGAGQYQLQPNDAVEWQYIKGQINE